MKIELQRFTMRINRNILGCEYMINHIQKQHKLLIEQLEQWIGLRIESENNAINQLINHIIETIENEQGLHFRLCLKGENFLIDQSILILPFPSPMKAPSHSNPSKYVSFFNVFFCVMFKIYCK